MLSRSKLQICAAVASLFFAVVMTAASSQELEISVSPSPVGSGARAAGMADAFVAVADDATAASWNPAGLVQLERPEISIVGSFNSIHERLSAPGHPEFRTSASDENYDLNYLSVAYPLPFLIAGRNACVSLNYQRKYDFSRSFKVDYHRSATIGGHMRPTPLFSKTTLDFRQKGGLSTITPAAAIELTNRLSVGLAVNLWRPSFLADNSWQQDTSYRTSTFLDLTTFLGSLNTREKYEKFRGTNVTAGLLWAPTHRINIGLRYDSAFTGRTDYSSRMDFVSSLLPSLTNSSVFHDHSLQTRKERRYVRFPASAAIGTAFRANDRLTVSMDVTRTNWKDFYVEDSDGYRYSLVDFGRMNNTLVRPRFKPTWTVRLGAERVLIPKQPTEELGALWSLRGGLFYDEQPATGRHQDFRRLFSYGTGKPERFYGFALGAGVLAGRRVNIDIAYQLRFGNNVNRDLIRGVRGFSEDVIQHRALISTVIYL